jgi:hypothetical protein
MPAAAESGGTVALLPRPLTSKERAAARCRLAVELPRLQGLLDAARSAADGPDPEAALVFLGMLTARAAAAVFPL